MNGQDNIILSPIGIVRCDRTPDSPHYPSHGPAKIEIYPEYAPALLGLTANSHIWVICYYPPRHEPVLQCRPRHVANNSAPRGVLAIRSSNHPNPLGLTLVRLLDRKGDTLLVDSLDAYDNTAVLDIKPYYAHDCVFSPRNPRIIHEDPLLRRETLRQLAYRHHGEECVGAALAVRIILALEAAGYCPEEERTIIEISGDPCLADALQGLCRARLAHPARFRYHQVAANSVLLREEHQQIWVEIAPRLPEDAAAIFNAAEAELFTLQESKSQRWTE